MTISADNLDLVQLKDSSLHRSLLFLNHRAAPIQITGVKSSFLGPREVPQLASSMVENRIQIQVEASQPIAAVNAQIIYFDTFNTELERQTFFWQRDVRPGEHQTLTWTAQLDRSVFGTMLSSALYFDEVRLADGTVWTTNSRLIMEELHRRRLEAKQ